MLSTLQIFYELFKLAKLGVKFIIRQEIFFCVFNVLKIDCEVQ